METMMGSRFGRNFAARIGKLTLALGHEPGRLSAPRALPPGSYPAGARSVELALAAGDACFKGDLDRLSSTPLASRAVVEVADEAEFAARFVSGDRLHLDSVVRIRRGGLALPARLRVERGGMVLVPGTVTSHGVRNPSDVPLVVCSGSGDVEIDTEAAGHELALVALEGTLRALGDGPLRIRGALAVGELSHDALRHGGDLAYDARLDPTARTYRGFYRGYLADCDSRWRLP